MLPLLREPCGDIIPCALALGRPCPPLSSVERTQHVTHGSDLCLGLGWPVAIVLWITSRRRREPDDCCMPNRHVYTTLTSSHASFASTDAKKTPIIKNPQSTPLFHPGDFAKVISIMPRSTTTAR
jgi:hypothetical protein